MNTHSFSPNRGMFVKMRQFPGRALLLDSGGGDQGRARVQGRDLCRAQVQRQSRRRRAGLRSPAHGFGLGHRYRTTALPEGIPRFGRCAPSLGMTGGGVPPSLGMTGGGVPPSLGMTGGGCASLTRDDRRGGSVPSLGGRGRPPGRGDACVGRAIMGWKGEDKQTGRVAEDAEKRRGER